MLLVIVGQSTGMLMSRVNGMHELYQGYLTGPHELRHRTRSGLLHAIIDWHRGADSTS